MIDSTADSSGSDEENKKDERYFYGLFEAILFLSNDPLPVFFFSKNFEIDPKNVKIILDSLVDEYEERGGGILLKEISGGYQFVTRSMYANDIRKSLLFDKKEGLTKGMLEALSIIAYKQPIILAQVDELRGVSSRMVLAKLMKKNLIRPVGRKELPGRPLLYGTTDEFLKHFGLKNLSDLPNISEVEEFYYEERE
ncbi:MAG: SMC-Scp complex subunit ScpB [Spirochaetes bacterium]|nr:SMC-Scp complex subunit ScpB [Spirochaetota bacterium]